MTTPETIDIDDPQGELLNLLSLKEGAKILSARRATPLARLVPVDEPAHV